MDIGDRPIVLTFTLDTPRLRDVDLSNVREFSGYIENVLCERNAIAGIGLYGENRTMYTQPRFTQAAEPRTVHLAMDIFKPAGSSVYSPMDATVHSFAYNSDNGDYGHTIILQHTLEGITFYTLYGHLSASSIKNFEEGQRIGAGEQIATLGTIDENGGWPPHLHFQIITDMLSEKGNFIGVSEPSKFPYWSRICPNPNLILKLEL